MKKALLSAFRAAVNIADPELTTRAALAALTPPCGRVVVISVGKAAMGMARAALAWNPEARGVVVTPMNVVTSEETGSPAFFPLVIFRAGHPTPNEGSVLAAQATLTAVASLSRHDLVLALLSGGGSALLSAPMGLSLAEKQAVTRELLACGASIQELNAVRKHLSLIKGGRLAVASAPATLRTVVISDVVGDDVSTIASGPTAPDWTTFRDAMAVLDHYQIRAPAARRVLAAGEDGLYPETPKAGDPAFDRSEFLVAASNRAALAAAVADLERRGLKVKLCDDAVTGESDAAGAEHAARALTLKAGTGFCSGGETTVTVRGPGRGGRNLQFALSLAVNLRGAPGVWAILADTDGIDGGSHAAGAIVMPDTLERAKKLGLDATEMLAANNAHAFFAALGDLVVTGPTGTNVNDLRVIVREP